MILRARCGPRERCQVSVLTYRSPRARRDQKRISTEVRKADDIRTVRRSFEMPAKRKRIGFGSGEHRAVDLNELEAPTPGRSADRRSLPEVGRQLAVGEQADEVIDECRALLPERHRLGVR